MLSPYKGDSNESDKYLTGQVISVRCQVKYNNISSCGNTMSCQESTRKYNIMPE